MKTRSSGEAMYDSRERADRRNHLIVAYEISNVGIDKGHLSSMANQATDALEAEKIEVRAGPRPLKIAMRGSPGSTSRSPYRA